MKFLCATIAKVLKPRSISEVKCKKLTEKIPVSKTGDTKQGYRSIHEPRESRKPNKNGPE
jgi:hypothetical protein